jgi:Ran GTPase-activating protein (RanGAP) involved in mRNA processing and transport
MGFGSYDESEQRDQDTDDFDGEDGVETEENAHEGSVEFEFEETSNEDLIDRLEDIK